MTITAGAAEAKTAIAIAAPRRLPLCTNAIANRVRIARETTPPHLAPLTDDWLTMMRWRRASSACSTDLTISCWAAGTIGAQAERQRLEICKRLRRGG